MGLGQSSGHLTLLDIFFICQIFKFCFPPFNPHFIPLDCVLFTKWYLIWFLRVRNGGGGWFHPIWHCFLVIFLMVDYVAPTFDPNFGPLDCVLLTNSYRFGFCRSEMRLGVVSAHFALFEILIIFHTV